jgi:hypothetical protein
MDLSGTGATDAKAPVVFVEDLGGQHTGTSSDDDGSDDDGSDQSASTSDDTGSSSSSGGDSDDDARASESGSDAGAGSDDDTAERETTEPEPLAAGALGVLCKDGNAGAVEAAQFSIELSIANTGDATNVQSLSLHYYFTQDESSADGHLVFIDDAGPSFGLRDAVEHRVVEMDDVEESADHYVELTFEDATCEGQPCEVPAGTVDEPGFDARPIKLRVQIDPSALRYDLTNDYSYTPEAESLQLCSRITLYHRGELIFGVEPDGTAPESPDGDAVDAGREQDFDAGRNAVVDAGNEMETDTTTTDSGVVDEPDAGGPEPIEPVDAAVEPADTDADVASPGDASISVVTDAGPQDAAPLTDR